MILIKIGNDEGQVPVCSESSRSNKFQSNFVNIKQMDENTFL